MTLLPFLTFCTELDNAPANLFSTNVSHEAGSGVKKILFDTTIILLSTILPPLKKIAQTGGAKVGKFALQSFKGLAKTIGPKIVRILSTILLPSYFLKITFEKFSSLALYFLLELTSVLTNIAIKLASFLTEKAIQLIQSFLKFVISNLISLVTTLVQLGFNGVSNLAKQGLKTLENFVPDKPKFQVESFSEVKSKLESATKNSRPKLTPELIKKLKNLKTA